MIIFKKIAIGQRDIYTTGCLLDYNCFNKHLRMISRDLSKQQALHADPKVIQQINFTGNLKRDNGAIMFSIDAEAKKSILDCSQGTAKVLWMCSTILFCSNIIIKWNVSV